MEGTALLLKLSDDVPRLLRQFSEILIHSAGDLEAVVYSWDVEALEESLEQIHASTGAIEPEMPPDSGWLGLAAPRKVVEAAESSFQQSVGDSGALAQQLKGQVQAFATEQDRWGGPLRKLQVNLEIESGTLRSMLDRRRSEHFRVVAELRQRALESTSPASKSALTAMWERSVQVRQRLRVLEELYGIAQRLHGCCVELRNAAEALVTALTKEVQPAFEVLARDLATLQSRRNTPSGRQWESRVRAGQATFQGQLGQAMEACLQLQQVLEETRRGIDDVWRWTGRPRAVQ